MDLGYAIRESLPRVFRQVWSAQSILLLYACAASLAFGQQSLAPTVHGDELSSKLIYDELKSRGVDPLQSTAPAVVRKAFVKYDFETGGGASLESSNKTVAAKDLNQSLQSTALVSTIRVSTAQPGARIKYRLIGLEEVNAIPQLTNSAEDTIPIGLYYIWAERAGKVTSNKDFFVRVIKTSLPIELEETLK